MLHIKDLSCGYGTKIVLKDINLDIEVKEFAGIIGPNGSGKTTLLRAISRIIKPIKGCIVFQQNDLWRTGIKEVARNMAVVSQVSEFGFMSVEEFILLGRIPYFRDFQFLETKNDCQIAQQCMELTDTVKLKDKPINNISSGERQLCCIARALAQEPKLLLLDEPTAHLDIAHQVGILDLLKRLNKQLGLTVVTVLHDLNLASEYCQRLVMLSNGNIFREGVPKDVLTYETIEEVYKTIVVIEKNPISKKPYILLVSEEERTGLTR